MIEARKGSTTPERSQEQPNIGMRRNSSGSVTRSRERIFTSLFREQLAAQVCHKVNATQSGRSFSTHGALKRCAANLVATAEAMPWQNRKFQDYHRRTRYHAGLRPGIGTSRVASNPEITMSAGVPRSSPHQDCISEVQSLHSLVAYASKNPRSCLQARSQ